MSSSTPARRRLTLDDEEEEEEGHTAEHEPGGKRVQPSDAILTGGWCPALRCAVVHTALLLLDNTAPACLPGACLCCVCLEASCMNAAEAGGVWLCLCVCARASVASHVGNLPLPQEASGGSGVTEAAAAAAAAAVVRQRRQPQRSRAQLHLPLGQEVSAGMASQTMGCLLQGEHVERVVGFWTPKQTWRGTMTREMTRGTTRETTLRGWQTRMTESSSSTL